VYFTIMAEDAVQCLQGQIPPFSLPLNPIQELNALKIVVEKTDPVLPAEIGEHSFSVMPERGVSDIVSQGNRFNKIFIQPQESPDGPGDFGDQLNMKHPMGNMIVLDQIEYLCFIDIPHIGPRMEDPVRIN
jgi:hypothetical protein